jgi:hypothetical protein
MLHWYSKVIIILRKRKNGKKTIIVRRRVCHDFCPIIPFFLKFAFKEGNTFDDQFSFCLFKGSDRFVDNFVHDLKGVSNDKESHCVECHQN